MQQRSPFSSSWGNNPTILDNGESKKKKNNKLIDTVARVKFRQALQNISGMESPHELNPTCTNTKPTLFTFKSETCIFKFIDLKIGEGVVHDELQTNFPQRHNTRRVMLQTIEQAEILAQPSKRACRANILSVSNLKS